MTESAEWWGAINEQMRFHKGKRNLPSPKVFQTINGETDELEARASLEVSKIDAFGINSTIGANENAKIKNDRIPPPMPVRGTTPQLKNINPNQLEHVSKPLEVAKDSHLSEIDAFSRETPPEYEGMSKLSMSERMDLAMKGNGNTNRPSTLEIEPVFADSSRQEIVEYKPPSSAWDSLEGDNAGW